MVRNLILLVLFSFNCFGSNVPTVSSVIQIGGSPLTTNGTNVGNPAISIPIASIGSLRTLTTGIASTTTGNFLMLVNQGTPGAQAQYQVTTGKTLYCYNLTSTGDATSHLQFGYGTAALGSDNTATPPTGVKYFTSGSSAVTSGYINPPLTVASVISYPTMIYFPALSFPFVAWTGSISNVGLRLDCIEQ